MSSRKGPTPYQVRDARADDVPLLQAIERNAAQRYGELPETLFCVDLGVRDEVEHRQARESGFALLIEVSGIPIAFILVVPKDNRAHILEIAVAQAEHGRGYGRELIHVAEAWATAVGLNEMTLTTFLDVPWNAPFYRRLGYEVFEVGLDRPELCELIAEERKLGLHQVRRVAMHKALPIRPKSS